MPPPSKILFFRPPGEAYLMAEKEFEVHSAFATFREACKHVNSIKGIVICVETPLEGEDYASFESFRLMFFLRSEVAYEGPILITSYFPEFSLFEKDRSKISGLMKKYEYFFHDPALKFVPLIELISLSNRQIDRLFPFKLSSEAAHLLREHYYDPLHYFSEKITAMERELCQELAQNRINPQEISKRLAPLRKELEDFCAFISTPYYTPQIPPPQNLSSQEDIWGFCGHVLTELGKINLPPENGRKQVLLIDQEEVFIKLVRSKLVDFGIEVSELTNLAEAKEHVEKQGKEYDVILMTDGLDTKGGKVGVNEMALLIKELKRQHIKWLKLSTLPSRIRRVSPDKLDGADAYYFKDDFWQAGSLGSSVWLQLVRDIRMENPKLKRDKFSFQGKMRIAYLRLNLEPSWRENIERIHQEADSFIEAVLSNLSSPLNYQWQKKLHNTLDKKEEDVFLTRLTGRLIILGFRNLIETYRDYFALPPRAAATFIVIRYIMMNKAFRQFDEWPAPEKKQFDRDPYSFFSSNFKMGVKGGFDYKHAHAHMDLLEEEKKWLEAFGKKWIEQDYFKRIIGESSLGKP